MLFKNLVKFSLLALQAGFSVAKPLSGPGRYDETIAELEPALHSRTEDKRITSGTVTGKEDQTVSTIGLATCAGLAASGNAGPGGINKVLAHVQCLPKSPATFRTQAQDWADAVRASGMTEIKIVVDVLNPALAPPVARQAQEDINNAAKEAAQSIGAFSTHYRQSMADPAPGGELKVNLDGSITIGGQRVRV